MQVWKISIAVDDKEHAFELPSMARVVHVACQDQKIRARVEAWLLVEPSYPNETRKFRAYGTGQPIAEPSKYLGTALTDKGEFVWHLFESIK